MRRRGFLFSAASVCAFGAPAAVLGSPVAASRLEVDAGTAALQHVLQPFPQTPQATKEQPRQLRGRFLHISDFHPDAFYKAHTSTDEDYACHRGEGPAGYYGAETSDCDTPFALVNATFDWIEKNLKDEIDFVIWTGDSARHDSDEQIPRNAKQVLGTNTLLAEKFRDTFFDEKADALSVPVVPTFGNNDILPHNIMLPGPNRWLQYYTTIWRHFIPEEQRHSFELGGWFYVEVIPNKLAVFSLNTLYFFDRNAAIDNCVDKAEPGFKQLEWMRAQLQFLRDRGMKAILMGHVPPARTDSKMLWDESCWQKYTLWLKQYRDVVIASLYGHMNIDHFMLQDTKDITIHKRTASASDHQVRESMDDELTTQGANDYLMELRERWSKLPKPPSPAGSGFSSDSRRGKKDSLGGPWAERYQLSIVSPSIVPNYFPTLRVIEYNITGLETASVWRGPTLRHSVPASLPEVDEWESDLRKAGLIEVEKRKKKKKGKGSIPHDPKLVVPEPPSKSAPPGPAYSPQPLTLLGYTQYFANLTYINNDIKPDVETDGWRRGKHRGKQPDKSTGPREFKFEVEYSTFKDKILKLPDLTVSSYLRLAYRMGKREVEGKSIEADDSEVSFGDADGADEGEDDEEEDSLDSADAGGDDMLVHHGSETVEEQTKKKKKRPKKHKKHNKVWLHFLEHAFVSTLSKKKLEKLDG